MIGRTGSVRDQSPASATPLHLQRESQKACPPGKNRWPVWEHRQTLPRSTVYQILQQLEQGSWGSEIQISQINDGQRLISVPTKRKRGKKVKISAVII